MIRVLGDRVLVALPPQEDEITTASGLVLVKDPDRFYSPTRGIVVQVGEKVGSVDIDAVRDLFLERCDYYAPEGPDVAEFIEALNKLRPAPFDVQVGDCVIFGLSAGDHISQDGIDYVVLNEEDIIGVVEPKEEAVV